MVLKSEAGEDIIVEKSTNQNVSTATSEEDLNDLEIRTEYGEKLKVRYQDTMHASVIYNLDDLQRELSMVKDAQPATSKGAEIISEGAPSSRGGDTERSLKKGIIMKDNKPHAFYFKTESGMDVLKESSKKINRRNEDEGRKPAKEEEEEEGTKIDMASSFFDLKTEGGDRVKLKYSYSTEKWTEEEVDSLVEDLILSEQMKHHSKNKASLDRMNKVPTSLQMASAPSSGAAPQNKFLHDQLSSSFSKRVRSISTPQGPSWLTLGRSSQSPERPKRIPRQNVEEVLHEVLEVAAEQQS